MLWKTLCQECGSLVSLFWGDEELQNMRAPCRSPVYIAQGTRHTNSLTRHVWFRSSYYAWFCLTLNSGSFKEHHPQIPKWSFLIFLLGQISWTILPNFYRKCAGGQGAWYDPKWLWDTLSSPKRVAWWFFGNLDKRHLSSEKKRAPWLFRVYGHEILPCPTQLCGDDFLKHYKDLYFSQPGFNGKYPEGFFRGSLGQVTCFNMCINWWTPGFFQPSKPDEMGESFFFMNPWPIFVVMFVGD